MAFAQQERKKIISEDPSLKSDIGKVGKMLGERWRKLSDGEKAKYKSMGGPTRKASKKSRKATSEAAPSRKEKKSRKGTRKLSGYMKFVKAERGRVISENPKLKSDIMAVGKEMGKRWRSMSDAEKAKYN